MRQLLLRLGLGEVSHDPTVRAISWLTLITRIGNGLFSTIEVIYITVVVGLSPLQVGLAMGIGGAVAMLFTVPGGMIVDRVGAKKIVYIANIVEALGIFSLIFVRDFWALVAVNACIAIVGMTGHNAIGTAIAQLGDGEVRVKIRASERALANMGIGIGTVFAGIGLWVNTTLAFQLVIFADFLIFLVALRFIGRLPMTEPKHEKGAPISFVAIKDKRFLAATLLNGIVSMHFAIQGIALPLWIIHWTTVPNWWMSVLFVINTVLVTALQIRFSKGTGSLLESVKKFRLGTAYLLLCCFVYGLAAHLPLWVSAGILVVGMLIHTVGELLTAAGSWSIGFELAVEEHMGQYQGTYSLGWSLASIVAPTLVALLPIGLGLGGWMIFGFLFLFAGLAMYRLCRDVTR